MEFEKYNTIKRILNQGCNVIYKFDFEISSYKNVIQIWKMYKHNNILTLGNENRKLIKDIFNFHKTNIDHVILVFSKNNNDCLLMCKIKGRYINLLIPSLELNQNQKSFAAIYC